VVNLARLRSRLGGHSPETSGPVDMVAIGDIQDLAAIPRPGRVDLMIHGTVVVARQITPVLFRQLPNVAEPAGGEISHEEMEMPVEGAGDEHQAPSIRRESGL